MGREADLALRSDAGTRPRDGVRRLAGAYHIEVGRIRPDPDQPRRTFTEEDHHQLTASVRERGIRQPLRVRYVVAEDVYLIVSGERRYRAAVAAQLALVPCIVEDENGGTTAVPLIDQIVENWQRADLEPFELSDALAILRDKHGLSQEAIASRTGKPKSEVSRLLSMQRVAQDVQRDIRADATKRYSRRHVVTLSQLPVDEQRKLLRRIKDEHLSAVATEAAGRRVRERPQGMTRGGTRVTVKRYSAGVASVEVRIRKGSATCEDVLAALDAVRSIVAAEADKDQ